MLRLLKYWGIFVVMIAIAWFTQCRALRADVIIMATGEHFTTSEIWEEGDKIRFNMHGIMVSVNKDEVLKIIRDKENPALRPAPKPVLANPKQRPESQTPLRLSTPEESPRKTHEKAHDANLSPVRDDTQKKSKDKGTGVEGFSWRTPFKQLTGLEKVETDPAFGGIDQYRKKDQVMQFAGVPIDGMVYGFWEDQLYSIMIWTEGRINYTKFKHALFSKYGKGSQRRHNVERYIWDEEQTQRMLEFDDQLKTGIFIMRSSELDEIIKQKYPG